MGKLSEDRDDKLRQTIEEFNMDGAEEKLNSFQVSFMASMAGRYEQYGSDTYCSDKQWRIVEEIYDVLVGA